MTEDFREFAAFPRRWQRPNTSLGSWSQWLLAGFAALMILPLVPAQSAMQRTEAASGDGHILWRFDSGG